MKGIIMATSGPFAFFGVGTAPFRPRAQLPSIMNQLVHLGTNFGVQSVILARCVNSKSSIMNHAIKFILGATHPNAFNTTPCGPLPRQRMSFEKEIPIIHVGELRMIHA